MPRLSIFILMLVISSLGAAQEQTAPRDAYMPLFLMYSGDPSPERLQALQQFLDANNTPKEVIKDTLETVIYKLKTFILVALIIGILATIGLVTGFVYLIGVASGGDRDGRE